MREDDVNNSNSRSIKQRKKNVKRGIRTPAISDYDYLDGKLQPERSALDHSAILTKHLVMGVVQYSSLGG